MAREIYRRTKSSNKRQSKSAGHYPSPYRMSSMELFSRMSMEALQAIDETRQEMKKKTIKENVTSSQGPEQEVEPSSATPPKQAAVIDRKADDSDSAIGTSSMRSNPAGSGEVIGASHHTPPATPTKPPDKPQKTVVRAHHVMTDDEIKKRIESRHPSLRPSQFAQECNKRHMPLVTSPTETKKLSVFHRLSTPVAVSYKPTSRQRARARLSLSLSVNSDKPNHLAFGQRREPAFRRDSVKSAFPTVLRSLKPEEIFKPPPRHEVSKTTIMLNNRRPKQANYPSLSKSYAKMEIVEKKPVLVSQDESSDRSEESIPERRLHTSRQFEITPMGYDSRYKALRYDQTMYSDKDFEECELIQQSKVKCQQWLAQQASILTNS